MSQKDLVSDHVKTLIKGIHTNNFQDKLFLVAAAVELLRRAQRTDKRANHAIANFFAKVADVQWEKVPFSFTDAVLRHGHELVKQHASEAISQDASAKVLLDALALFVDILADAPDEATQAVFEAVVAELAAQGPEPPAAPVTVPEIFQPRMADRCFKAKPLDERLCSSLQMGLVLYKANHGPLLRGVAFDNDLNGTMHCLLETGEYVQVPVESAALSSLVAPEDYANVPAVLLAYVCASVPHHFETRSITSAAASGEIVNGCLGAFSADTVFITAAAEDVKTLQHVIDTAKEADSIGAVGATGPAGASVRFSVPNTDLQIVLDAVVASTGPYVLSRIVRTQTGGADIVLMRHEQPREVSPYGIYLFPLKDISVVLKVL